MCRREMRSVLQSLLLMVVALLCPTAPALRASEYLIEDPSSLTEGQQWYLIAFDANGTCTRNEGWGYDNGFTYYPLTDTYRQWFYRGPYSSTGDACMTVSAAIVSADSSRGASAEMNVIWTTPEWSAMSSGSPPMPGDVATSATESKYVGSDTFQSVPPSFFGTVEPVRDYTIVGYCPEWVGLDVSGHNVMMLRYVAPTCAGASKIQGACYNKSTGDCFLTEEQNCTSPYTWLGANTTCSDVGGSSGATVDLGDAPDTYGTIATSDGARHTVVTGVYLGRLIDAESEGLPTSTATGDDNTGIDDEDGVVFSSTLTPGETATIEVTASVAGYLNAWVDFNRDGTFSGTGEQIFADTYMSAGTSRLTFSVPAAAGTGDTFARFRFSRRGLLSWTGLAEDGEVEDYKVSVATAFAPQASANRGAAKWFQSPEAVSAATPYVFQSWAELSNTSLSQIVADDWQCQDDRPVTGFQFWGTFSGWTQYRMPSQKPSAFQVSIWTNSPATSKNSFARPDTMVWQATCTNWVWSVAGQAHDPRAIKDDEACFEFTCLLSQDQWFYQDPGSGTTTYWVSIAAVYDTTDTLANPWGWMTGPDASNNGAVKISAVNSAWPPSLGSAWSAGSQIVNAKGTIQHLAFNMLTNDGQTVSDLNLAPVYRFWSSSVQTHFYTISEAEKEKLISLFSDIWYYEGVAFYAYPPSIQPSSALPVYRFRSAKDSHHFYTISESEKTKLITTLPNYWIYEGIVWYAYESL